ncbi:MAG: hypothetical protein K2K64_10360, partial [Muribaculaceae bacterium]|nr:hypothetical protein [Muribaculaceae bacterium]
PYSYCGGDPVNLTDHEGLEINFKNLYFVDENSGFTTTENILRDLRNQTGLSLFLDEEKILRYEKDENNTPMVSQIMYKGKLSDSGSQTARAILIEAIDSDIIVNVVYY